ncbi:MarR family winged helix-turn-helix transcriptional regulator [Janibacter sp. GXQ6167]|uniref:MarR family winged helix-turn-helix transcriptional regulator n=1 Tax=Janibacter sp. GXQ6167 TaxID=3240791 RepID=UPI0035237808
MESRQRLDQQLCFALYTAARTAAAAYRDDLAELGLTYTQYVTLLALWERDGQTVSELGEALRLDSGTLSPLLRRLEAAGFVERLRDQDDERRVNIHLTDAAQALETQACALQDKLAQRVHLTPAEAETLRSLAQRFSATTD